MSFCHHLRIAYSIVPSPLMYKSFVNFLMLSCVVTMFSCITSLFSCVVTLFSCVVTLFSCVVFPCFLVSCFYVFSELFYFLGPQFATLFWVDPSNSFPV